VEVRLFPDDEWAGGAAAVVADALPDRGNVVITGGRSAARVYPSVAAHAPGWEGIDVFFSDERAVPPDHKESNYRMAKEKLLDRVRPSAEHRIRGEIPPEEAADEYAAEMGGRSIDLMILGVGEDAHVAALFPGSRALEETRPCVAVERPDGMQGVTLTPPVLLGAAKVLFVVSGAARADAVARGVRGNEPPSECPVRLFASHGDVTMLLDDAAAARL
jgi:6-phosphogluconolactonase